MRKRLENGTYASEGTLRERFERHFEMIPIAGCWLWSGTQKNKKGYGHFTIDGRAVSAHRVAFEIYRHPIPTGAHVLHACDVPACVNPSHLWLGDAAKNNKDRDVKGRHRPLSGEAHGMRKLTESAVRRILESSESAQVLSAELGVCKSNIYYIRAGKSWRHIKYTPQTLGVAIDDLRVVLA